MIPEQWLPRKQKSFLSSPKRVGLKRMNRITVKDILNRKQKEKRKITVLTAYDFPFAKLVDEAGLDIVLVGDSVGMVCLGYETTIPVSMREMLHHVKAVRRAVKHALLVADMPFGSYQGIEAAIRNARRFLKEAGAEAVKVEGGKRVLAQVKALVRAGIPVMGHLGMTPQSVNELGGYKVQGREAKQAGQILEDALLLDKLGVFAVVLECIPASLAQKITQVLRIPTIGIGAGPHCTGQVLVLYDLLGLYGDLKPKFVKQYGDGKGFARKALELYVDDVKRGKFPEEKHSFK